MQWGPPRVPGRRRQRAAPGEARPGPRTDGAVLAVPARAALALAVAAGSVLRAARVAGALVAGRPHPAVLAAARAPHADAMAPAVGSTDLCGAGGEKTGTEQAFLGNKGHTRLPSAGLHELSGFQRLRANPCGQGPPERIILPAEACPQPPLLIKTGWIAGLSSLCFSRWPACPHFCACRFQKGPAFGTDVTGKSDLIKTQLRVKTKRG